MKVFSDLNDPQVVALLKQGAVGVIPTDTLYGIVATIRSQEAVERVYRLRERNGKKACIVLVGKVSDITDRDAWTEVDHTMVKKYWPGKVSIVLPVTNASPEYIHRGLQSIAYRFPDDPKLQHLLQKTGPIIAPSANTEGQPPATTVAEAQTYFGAGVDFYVDGGTLRSEPSTVLKANNGDVSVLRPGAVKI